MTDIKRRQIESAEFYLGYYQKMRDKSTNDEDRAKWQREVDEASRHLDKLYGYRLS